MQPGLHNVHTHNIPMQYIVTDTDTGGLYPSIHALLSIGACCTWSAETYLAYITVDSQPGKTVSAEAIAKNGYSAEKWEALGARPLDIVMAEFLEWIADRKKARHSAKIVCHNLAFDRSFFQESENVTGLKMPHRNDWRCSQVKFGELMDLGALQEGSTSLNRLIELSMWEDTRTEIHNALQDAQATQHGYLWLLDQAKSAENTLRQLYLSGLTERRRLEALIVQSAQWLQTETVTGQSLVAGKIIEEAARLKAAQLPEWPRFWFEGNQHFGWVESRADWQTVVEKYAGHSTEEELLTRCLEDEDSDDAKFGFTSECKGPATLGEFLLGYGINLLTKEGRADG